jgi:hypothetical protein
MIKRCGQRRTLVSDEQEEEGDDAASGGDIRTKDRIKCLCSLLIVEVFKNPWNLFLVIM